MSNLKFLYTDVYYPRFVSGIYGTSNDLSQLNYEKQLSIIHAELFATSNFYTRNLRKLGWVTQDSIINIETLQKKWAWEHGVRSWFIRDATLGRIPYIRGKFRPVWATTIFLEQVRSLRPDVLFMQDIGYIDPEFLSEAKRFTKVLIGQTASPLPPKSNLKAFDLILTSLPNYVRDIERAGVKAKYFKLGFEKDILNKVFPQRKKYDTTFIGGFSLHHHQRAIFLEELATKTKFDIWGYGSSTLDRNSPLHQYHHGEVWGKQMYKILLQSKITINKHDYFAKNYANNMRLFEATGCGALLITDYKDNLSELFRIGTEAETYKSVDELAEKIKYYLANDSKRDKIARAGQRRTLSEHTYFNRMKELNHIITDMLK